MTQTHRGGRLPESLMGVHRNLLLVQWQRLSTPDLWNHLYRVVGAEHQRYPKVIDGVRYFGDPRLQPQLRWRRLAAAKELALRGVQLDPLLFGYSLPHRQWPGLARLLGRRPAETSSGHA
jgi:hypothetical protein